MKVLPLVAISLLAITELCAQQTVDQTLILNSNGVNSTEILMKKIDNTNYNSLFSNDYGFGIFNSNTGGTNFFINAVENIGIGTTTPEFKLSVMGQIFSSAGSNEGGAIWLENTFKTGNNAARRWAIYNMTGSYGNSLQFWNYSQDQSMYGARFTITDDGNVGIGTTTPLEKLDVRGNTFVNGGIISSVAGAEIGGNIQINNPAKAVNGAASSWKIFNMTGAYGNSLQFWAYDNLGCTQGGLCANRLTLMDNGNVGIGTTTPAEKFQVNGNVRWGGDTNYIYSGQDATGVYFEQSSDVPAQNKIRLQTSRNGDHINYTYLSVDATNGFSFQTIGNANGNVGIGTANPDEKLAVNGKIHAREVRVDAKDWPDYVFKPGYKLPTLNEIEKQIKEKGHLPDMPSAKIVEKNGLELGEMLKLQQQKIEELTLYMIAQQKEINDLKQRLIEKNNNKKHEQHK
ncbi:hypothetical protein [Pedobacter sp.]|uniref:hypothetical protein n=1 Tax=Pedobacter sp. TaxID=1411316 RepID=UPI003BA8618B